MQIMLMQLPLSHTIITEAIYSRLPAWCRANIFITCNLSESIRISTQVLLQLQSFIKRGY